MPSVSKKQQKFMGIVRSIQKGEQPAGKFSKDAQDAAKSMKKGSVKKYAKTKHDDLPVKKESTAAYKKSLEKIVKDKQLKMLSKKDKETLMKIAKMMKEAMTAPQSKAAHKKFKETGELPPHLEKLVKDLDKIKVKHKVKNVVVPGMEWMSKLGEERDYKDEYKKFQSSTKSKKYRAELNKYNRKKGTYGNGDGKDASHKGGKIVGFESQSKNRGRAEKSRLKKEGKLNENPAAMAAAQAMTKIKMKNPKTGKEASATSALKDKDNPNHKKAKGIFSKLKDRFTKKKKEEPKKQSKSDGDFYKRQFAGEEKIREYIRSEIKNGNITSKSLDETNKQTLLNIAKMMKGTNESVTEHTVTFTKDDMEKLHSSGEVIKADPDGKEHTYVYKEYVKV